MNNIKNDIYETSKDIWQEVLNTNALRLYRFYTMRGLNVIVEVSLPILKTIHHFYSEKVELALQAAKDFRDLYQATCVFPTLYNLSKSISAKAIFRSLENLSYTTSFLFKYEVCDFTSWQEWVRKTEKKCFFTFPLTKNLLNVPHDLFTLIHSGYDLCSIFYKYVYSPFKKNIGDANLPEGIKGQKRMDLLLFTRRIGQVSSIIIRNFHTNRIILSPWCRLTVSILEFSSGVAHFIRILIR